MTMAAMPWMMTPGDMQKQGSDFLRKMGCMPHVLDVAKKTRVGTTPSQSVFQMDKLRLLQYETDDQQRYATPLIVVFALVNRPYILDLRPGKSVVEHFLRQGFDTYNLDWGVPTRADRFLGMEDYVQRYMGAVVDDVREKTGSEKVNLLGYCMGGSISTMFTALNPDKVKNLILMASPVDWSSKEHLLAKWTDASVYDVDKLIDVHGNAPADMLQSSFSLLKPVSTLVEKYFSFYENMEDEKYLENFFAMEAWLNDNIPVAGEMFRQFVKECMQKNKLIQGKLRIGGRLVNLRDITCPLLNIAAAHDHLVPSVQSLPLNDAVGSTDRKAITFPAGHIGLAVGSKANRDLWPDVAKWLAERSDALAP